jgi:nucleoside-diphosphate-sugar epimerase
MFTIGPDEPVKIKQHAENIAKLIGWTGKINWNTKPKRHGEIYLLNSNSNKLTQLTGWKPKVSYWQGLQETVNYWQTQKH